jgi:hypothetical protein
MSWNIKTPGDYINGPLTVAGSATITGDLTVDTTTLKVDSTNNRVGIGTASPSYDLEVAGSVRSNIAIRGNFAGGTDIAHLRFVNANGSIVGDIFSQNTNGGASDTAYLSFQTASSGTLAERYRIAGDGVATWSNVGGVAGTAMTLNSTGLGIGASPSAYKLHVAGTGYFSSILTLGGASRISAEGSNALNLNTNSVDRLTIDSSGNVGVGVTPNTWTTYKALQVNGASIWSTTGNDTAYASNVYYDGAYKFRSASSDKACMYIQFGGQHQFHYTAAAGTAGNTAAFTQAMTLTAAGALLVGCTSAPNPGAATTSSGFSLNGDGNNAYIAHKIDNSILGYFRRDGTDGDVFAFYKANSNVGTIAVTTTATAYNTSSDYRLKESAQPLVGGLARVNALKPSVYKWKVNGSAGEGFIAHELAEVVPLAVTGDKDAVDADGKPAYQGVDMSRIVPILVAAIQELTAEVNALKNA